MGRCSVRVAGFGEECYVTVRVSSEKSSGFGLKDGSRELSDGWMVTDSLGKAWEVVEMYACEEWRVIGLARKMAVKDQVMSGW